MSRILGMDYGRRRIGLAITDPLNIIAQPYRTLDTRTIADPLKLIAGIVRDMNVGCIVIGLPMKEDATEGELVGEIRRLGGRLSSDCGVDVVYLDEAYTSAMAHDCIRQTGARSSMRNGDVDRIAAQIILRDYLERKGTGH